MVMAYCEVLSQYLYEVYNVTKQYPSGMPALRIDIGTRYLPIRLMVVAEYIERPLGKEELTEFCRKFVGKY